MNEDFEKYILSKNLENRNYKWKTNLTEKQIKVMEEILGDSGKLR